MTKKKEVPLKKGALSDEEKRTIEKLIRFENFSSIAAQLNRDQSTIRKYCQRNGITNDTSSVKKNIEEKKKRSPHFEELSNILTEREMDLAVKIYTELMKQFGGDILPSEEIQVIDFCTVSAMLNRVLAREKEITRLLEQQNALREALEREKAGLSDDDDHEKWYDRLDQVDLRIASLSDELKEVKKNQISFYQKKENANKAMHGSRDQRAKELAAITENWSDFVIYLKTNVQFRTKLGLELERARLSINEEFIRLSSLHTFADSVNDYPIFNSEVVERDFEREKTNE